MTESEFKSLKVGQLLRGSQTSNLGIVMLYSLDVGKGHFDVFPFKGNSLKNRYSFNGSVIPFAIRGGCELFERIGNE